jgi:phytoene/squalene synthetase
MENLYNDISFITSEVVIRTYSTSFSRAVSMLEADTRKAIQSIYGFVRLADEIVDSFLLHNQKNLLDKLEQELNDSLKENLSINPILNSFVQTVKKYNIPKDYIFSFLRSMRADLKKKIYKSQSETEEYIYGSAEVVGLMCLRVFLNGESENYSELENYAKKLGSAFQKVNFLRDLKADYEKLNRQYFPDFKKETFNESKKQKLIQNIKCDFIAAMPGIKKLPGKSRFAVLLAYLYFKKLLNKIQRTPAEKIIHKRIRVNNFIKLAITIKAYILYKFNLV